MRGKKDFTIAFAFVLEGLTQQPDGYRDANALKRAAPAIFRGYGQQDAQEFMGKLLEMLHEDLNLQQKTQKKSFGFPMQEYHFSGA